MYFSHPQPFAQRSKRVIEIGMLKGEKHSAQGDALSMLREVFSGHQSELKRWRGFTKHYRVKPRQRLILGRRHSYFLINYLPVLAATCLRLTSMSTACVERLLHIQQKS